MDPRLAITLAIVFVICVGFAWYERSRPSSRVVALVASLTALAVASRLVFAPIPNVVGTTDVALLTGYALGGPPGFVVGALAAPISNIWLGQGPWTIWQMAGWGLAGLAGAGLAAVLGRGLGRLRLALACGVMGVLYGALLDLSVMVTYGGEQSLDRYAALSVRGIPFNLAHAAGNFAIAFAAGPALVRMISRFRERLEFHWRPAGALPLFLVAGTVLAAGLIPAAPARADVGDARAWLASQQNSDGGFAASPGQASSAAMTTWAALGLEAAGVNPLDVTQNGRSAIDYLRTSRIVSATDLERTILVLEGAGLDATSFEGRNLVGQLRAKRSSDGSWQGQVNITAFGIMALRAAGQSDIGRSADWLRDAQNSNGGWGFAPGRPSDADSTGAVMQALAVAGGSSNALSAGSRYLAQTQRGSGGWTLAGGTENSQSTAWAVQGLVAAGGPGSAVSKGVAYLGRRQAGDGHYSYSGGSDQTPIWVTAQGILAVARKPFPLAAVPRAPQGATKSGGSGSGSPGSSGGSGTYFGGGTSAQGGRAARPDKERTAKQKRDKAGGAARPDGGADAKRSAGSPRSGEEAPLEAADAEESAGGGGLSGGARAGIGLGVLALALGGGFLWNRRGLG